MIVKFKGILSQPYELVGGGPQGTLLGGLQYIITSDDCSPKDVIKEDRFRYFDDLNILEFLILTDLLVQYEFKEHIPSDIGIDQQFLPPSSFKMQENLDKIKEWSDLNLMKINEKKRKAIL